MRFALVVEPESADSLDRLAPLRLAVMRAGFNVVRLRAGVNLRRDLTRAVDVTEKDDAALVYVAGDVTLIDGSIALAGAQPLPLDEVAGIICSRPLEQMLFVLDARAKGDAGDAFNALEHVEAIVRAVAPREHSVELLAAVESGPLEAAPAFALTRFFVQAIDDVTALDEQGTMRMSVAYPKLIGHPEFASSVPSFVHVKGPTDFVVVAPILERVSEPPPSRASAPPSSTRAPRSRSILPLPSIEPILADAERAQSKGRFDEALDGYRKALMILGGGEPQAMASLYASVAEVKLAQGKKREAEASFEKALSAAPDHTRSLRALADLAGDAKEFGRAAGYERRIALTRETGAERASALARVAERYVDAKDVTKAAAVLEEARQIAPSDFRILSSLRATYESMRNWRKAADTIGAMADGESLLHDKAARHFEQADVILGRLRDETAGLALLERALEEDPTHERALAAIVAIRSRKEEWGLLDRLYAKLIDAFAVREDAARAWDVCRRLGQLRRDKIGDGPGALEAFTAAVKLRPRDVETRAALAELLVAKGESVEATAELEIAARHEPTRAATYRRLFDLHRRAGATDRAWIAATVLEDLGAANVDQGMLADQFRGEGPRPGATLDADAWAALRAPGADEVVEAIVREIAPAAIAVKLAELRAAKRVLSLPPSTRLAPDSTVTVVRTFAWAAEVLGAVSPELYAREDIVDALAALQAPAPSTAFGESMMSGRTVPELAFFVARHLVYYRPEHYPLIFYPSVTEATALVLAAVKLARPELPVPAHAAEAAAKLRKELVAHATQSQRSNLAIAVERLDVRGGKVDLAAWIRGVELTANRAGLLLAGDLGVAMRMMREEQRGIADLTFEDRRGDLLGFSASRAYASLRAQLGIAHRASLPPPPPSSRARLG
jgi:tetratricopeptide (TPR) repeat protein